MSRPQLSSARSGSNRSGEGRILENVSHCSKTGTTGAHGKEGKIGGLSGSPDFTLKLRTFLLTKLFRVKLFLQKGSCRKGRSKVIYCGDNPSRCGQARVEVYTGPLLFPRSLGLLTRRRQVSARQKVPDLPMPALQCTTMGPCSTLSEPDSRTLKRKFRNEAGDSGTPKSGHVV